MAMTTFYPQYQQYSYPIAYNEWSPVIPVNLLYAIPPMPLIVNPVAMVSPHLCPYVSPLVIPPFIPSPILIPSDMSTVSSYYESASVSTELQSPVESFYEYDSEEIEEYETKVEDPIGYYLSLSKELFPSARMMTVDPNPLIDEFCILPNVSRHAPWILDLEFGVPKAPITRPIPSYNVKYNSIHCKNTPDAIHPGFESCSKNFKAVLLFYYDCIVSAWYRGYVLLIGDVSVENFQSWLQLPMQVFGMCW